MSETRPTLNARMTAQTGHSSIVRCFLCMFHSLKDFITYENQSWEYFLHYWPRGDKTLFVLNSVEHKILNAHKYKNIKKFSFFQVQISGEGYFSRS